MISLEGVGFKWPEASDPLFSCLNISFPEGETTCILGPNGSGKTTLLELILGWRHPDSGCVGLGNRPVGSIPARERGRTMALVPQDERLPFSYSVLEYVLLGRAPHMRPLASPGKVDRDLAMAVLDRVGIVSLAHRSVPSLSGGEQRLVLIARALVQEPRILLLDEPANHLDPANRERIIKILKAFHESGITLIMSSHEPDLVTRLARNLILLKAGEPPQMGRTDDMFDPDRLSMLYGVPVRIAQIEGRRVILWGD